MVKIFLVILLCLPFSVSAKNCKKGIPCGNTCISASKTCRLNYVDGTFKPEKPTFINQEKAISKQNFNTAKTQLTKIYKENPEQKEFYCGCQFSWQGKKGVVDTKSCGYIARKNQTRAERIEWEHVMPAENFGRHLKCWQDGGRKECKKDVTYNRMEGDMHNLQPAVGEVNGDRSNYRYSEFTQVFNQYGQCKAAVDFKDRKFQPRDEIKGIIARTYFYMSEKYNINLSKQDKQLMIAWDKTHPVTEWECKRNKLIKNIQGNDNHFITERCE
ncbi:endonuclease [Orbaceae bacterium ESL0721]|nr:endonuclease [Orbaceae bacterium ESL0721]